MKQMNVFSNRAKDDYKEFYLLNKNKLLAKFHVEGSGVLEGIEIDEQFEKMPGWIGNLKAFILNRRAPKKRKNNEYITNFLPV